MGWSRDAGTLRASFQKLSRIRDEVGTQRVYRRLGENGVDVYVYGMGNGDELAEEMDHTVHTGEVADYRDSWFVVHRSPEPESADGVALLAVQGETGVWDAFFTSDTGEVLAIDDHIRREL